MLYPGIFGEGFTAENDASGIRQRTYVFLEKLYALYDSPDFIPDVVLEDQVAEMNAAIESLTREIAAKMLSVVEDYIIDIKTECPVHKASASHQDPSSFETFFFSEAVSLALRRCLKKHLRQQAQA
jgi:hypothetical protein